MDKVMYGVHEAKHVHGDVYYVWRGEWADPCYVLKKWSEKVDFLGQSVTVIHGEEVNYWEVWSMYEDGTKATPQEIAEDVVELLA